MTRIITVLDEELHSTTRIEIERGDGGRHVVRRIVVESDDDLGLPHAILDALILGPPTWRDTAPAPAAPPPAPPPSRPKLPAAPKRPASRRGKHGRAPDDAELEAAIKQLGDRPRDLAGHFGVPSGIVSNWLYAWRKRTGQR